MEKINHSFGGVLRFILYVFFGLWAFRIIINLLIKLLSWIANLLGVRKRKTDTKNDERDFEYGVD